MTTQNKFLLITVALILIVLFFVTHIFQFIVVLLVAFAIYLLGIYAKRAFKGGEILFAILAATAILFLGILNLRRAFEVALASFAIYALIKFVEYIIKEKKDSTKKTLLILLLIGVGGFFQTLSAQSNFEYLQTDSKETSRLRPNLFYDLPLKIKGYSYLELYMDGQNYFGQTFLTREIKGIFGVEVNAYYASFFTDYIGIGPRITLPTNKSTILTFSLMPFFMEFNGKHKSKYILGEFIFFKEFKIPSLGKWRINSFGVINLAAEGGPTWEYGEVYLEKTFGSHFYIGAGADLFCNTKWYPDPNWGLKLGYSF